MVEISYNKKNIIILFISMIIIFLFIYKGFILDSNHYLKEYKNYLISINASEYYFNKINKNKNTWKSLIYIYNNKNIGNWKIQELLLKIKNYLNNSINIDEKIKANLAKVKTSKNLKLKFIINDTNEYLNQRKKGYIDLINLIEKFNIT